MKKKCYETCVLELENSQKKRFFSFLKYGNRILVMQLTATYDFRFTLEVVDYVSTKVRWPEGKKLKRQIVFKYFRHYIKIVWLIHLFLLFYFYFLFLFLIYFLHFFSFFSFFVFLFNFLSIQVKIKTTERIKNYFYLFFYFL